jgi:hypothetical protein
LRSIAEQYARNVKKDTRSYFASWLPLEKLDIGTVGILVHGCLLIRKTSLTAQGVSFDILNDNAAGAVDISSKSGVSITSKLAGAISADAPHIPEADAGIAIKFSKQAAYVIRSPKATVSRIADLAKLENELIAKHRKGEWHKDWVVITDVVNCESFDVLIAEGDSCSIELRAKVHDNSSPVHLGAGIGFEVMHMEGKTMHFLGIDKGTPLFQVAALRPSFPLLMPNELSKIGVLPSISEDDELLLAHFDEWKERDVSLRYL